MTNTTNNGGALPPTPAGVAGIAAAGDQTKRLGWLAIKITTSEECVLTDADGNEVAVFLLNAKQKHGVRVIVRAPADIRVTRRAVTA